VSYRSRNYVLCIGSRVERAVEEPAVTLVRSRERILMQTVSDGVLVVDTRGAIVESNSSADRMLGVAKSEIIGRSCVDSRWRLVDSDGSPLSISNHPLMITLVEEEPLFNRRINMLTTDGTRRMLMINASPVFDESGALTGAIGCIRPYEDSVERREQQQREERQNAMSRAVVQAMVTAGSVDDLERQFCEAMVQRGEYALAWRGVKKDTDERIHPSCSAGDAADYLMKVKIRYDDSEYGNGPLGRAMKTGEVVVVQDLSAEESYAPWLSQAGRTGLHSLAAFPLVHDGEEAGLLTLYSKDRNHFTANELGRLKELVLIFSNGLVLRRRIERARALQAAFGTQRTLLEAYEGLLPVAVARFDHREPFRCEEANSRFADLVDEPFHSTGVEGSFVSDFMYSVYHRDLYQQLQAAARAGATGADDAVFTDWQGQEMRWSWRIIPVSGDAGQEELLYVAYRQDGESAQQAAVPAGQSPAGQSPAAELDDAGVLRLAAPRFGPRAKAATRVERYMDEGSVLQANGAARRMFGVDATVHEAADPSVFFSDEDQALLEWMFMLKDSGQAAAFTIAGRSRLCRAYLSAADDGQEYLLFIE
jgi:PAS domain S-box-containing protein